MIKHERQVPPKAALGSEVCSMGDIHGPHMSVIPASVLQVMKHERQVPPEAAPGPEGCSRWGRLWTPHQCDTCICTTPPYSLSRCPRSHMTHLLQEFVKGFRTCLSYKFPEVGNEEEVKDWNDHRVNKEAKSNCSDQTKFDINNNFS